MTHQNGTAIQPAHVGQTHHEAPASASARFTSPAGVGWLITLRDDRANVLIDKVSQLESHLLANGWQPDGQRNGGGATAGGPMCPDGHGAMKPSTKKPGEYFCPAVVGTHPQTGKKLYCQHKA